MHACEPIVLARLVNYQMVKHEVESKGWKMQELRVDDMNGHIGRPDVERDVFME